MKPPIAPDRVRALHGTAIIPTPPPAPTGRGGPRGRLFRPVLTDDQVRDIRKRYRKGEKGASIAAAHGISQPMVSMIGTRQRHGGVR